MNITKEQIDYIKKALDHVDFLTGGSRNSKTKQIIEELQQENARLKDKLNDIEKILDADCCVENIYQAICQYLNIHDYELDLEDYLKEN